MYDVLRGVRVIEVSSWVFMPCCGAVLADWGADVIKVEHPVTGDPLRGITNAFVPAGGFNPMTSVPNRGKRSVGVDIATPGGRALLHKLIGTADVFMTSYRAAARQELGIEVDDIRTMNPDVIYARGTGQGSLGPDADKGGYDLVSTWARAGIAQQMTRPGGEPPGMPGSVGDLTSGIAAAGAIAAALFRRERTGVTSTVEVSLLAMGMWIMSNAIAAAPLGIVSPLGHRKTAGNPITNCYRTKDERWIWFALMQSDRFWSDFCRRLGRPDLIDDPRFVDHGQRARNARECIDLLDEIFAIRTLDEWCEAFETFEGVWAPARTALEVSQDPQAHANGYFPEVETDDDVRPRLVASPMQFDDSPVGSLRREPEHGEHTELVLLELGLSWSEIGDLKDAQVIV